MDNSKPITNGLAVRVFMPVHS